MQSIIALTRAWDAPHVAEEIGASHRVIISDPTRDALKPNIVRDGAHLRLGFHDIAAPRSGAILASEDQIHALIDFTHRWGGEQPLVVNCYAGRSRSPAALIIVLATLYPGRERQIIDMIVQGAPHARPNRHMIGLGDRVLGCGGRLIEAVPAMPEAARGFTGTAFFDISEIVAG